MIKKIVTSIFVFVLLLTTVGFQAQSVEYVSAGKEIPELTYEIIEQKQEIDRLLTVKENSDKEAYRKAVERNNFIKWFETLEQIENERQEALRQEQLRKERERQEQAAATTTTTQNVAPVSGGNCGGNLPPCCVMQRESGGSLTAQNPTSSASGKWQFINSTWNGYGGYAEAWMAPESVQDAKAAELWANGAGASHWGGGC